MSVKRSGFTLIELSIVLVIIGLIVGGILTGVDLVAAAAMRSQIAQIEKYNTAVHTFQGKYGGLPGDISNNIAVQFGFSPSLVINAAGFRDGNGVIEAYTGSSYGLGITVGVGETSLFWNDLGFANLIDSQFPSDTGNYITATAAQVSTYFPTAKIGNSNFVFVWSGGYGTAYGDNSGTGGGVGAPSFSSPDDGKNYFCVAQMSAGLSSGIQFSNPGLAVSQAYAIDKKIDDGFPQSGNVTAMYPTYRTHASGKVLWSLGGGSITNGWNPGINGTGAATPSPSSCFDNGGNNGVTQQYSTGVSNGTNVNCALSFQFQ